MTSPHVYQLVPKMTLLASFPSLTVVAILASLVWFFWVRPWRSPALPFPVENPEPGLNGLIDTVTSCLAKYCNTPYVLNTPRPIVVLPACCINDLKNVPEEKASLMDEVYIDLTQAVTEVGRDASSNEYLPTLRIDLTRRLNSIVPVMLDELRFALDATMGGPAEERAQKWSRQAIFPTITKLAALVNGRIFIGRPISRSPAWMTHAVGYTVDQVLARHALNKYPYYMKLLIGPLLPEVRRLRWHLESCKNVLRPVLEQLVALQDEVGSDPAEPILDEDFQDQQGTFCSWILKYAKPGADKLAVLASNQLSTTAVSNHVVGLALSRAIIDLAARPEYLAPLRQEIEDAIQEDGYELGDNGQKDLKKTTYVKLRKLDSFLKESQRLFPAKLVGMVRITRTTLRLSTGHVLPPGTRVGVPVYAIHTSPQTPLYSAETSPGADYVPPSRFDGFRYEKLRRLPGNDAKYQFVSTSNESLAFGLGEHCCPGRFYAAVLIKTIFVELLRFWDVRLVGDEQRQGGNPPRLVLKDLSLSQDPLFPVEMRRRVL